MGAKLVFCFILLGVLLHFVLFSTKAVEPIDRILDAWQGSDMESNPYLHGNFAPVAEEHRGIPLEVIHGALPPNLNGLFVRNGPNPIPSQISKRHHWFDGHGMMHNVRIRNGSAVYSNSYVPTPRYVIEKSRGKEVFFKIGELKGVPGLVKLMLLNKRKLEMTGTTALTSSPANTHSIMYSNKFYALLEAALPFELALSEDGGVKAVGYETFGGVLDYPVSAHPKVDAVTGNLVFHSYSADPSLGAAMKVGEISANNGKVQTYFGIHMNHTSFAHDMMFTENWIVLFDTSVVFAVTDMFKEGSGSIFKWNEAQNLRIGLVPRARDHTITEDDVIWMDVNSPHATVHPLNAWEEEDGTVVVWLPLGDYFYADFGSEDHNYFYMAELRMDPKTGMVTKRSINKEYNVEFSRVRDNCVGRFARFGYTGIIDPVPHTEGVFNGFAVWDMTLAKLHTVVRYPAGEFGGEPVLIPKPATSGSNQVYIGIFLYNEDNGASFFTLYDGENPSEEPIAKLSIPHRVPYGFHGRFVTETELQNHIQYHANKQSTSSE